MVSVCTTAVDIYSMPFFYDIWTIENFGDTTPFAFQPLILLPGQLSARVRWMIESSTSFPTIFAPAPQPSSPNQTHPIRMATLEIAMCHLGSHRA